MKKLLITVLATLCLSGCAVDESMAKPEPVYVLMYDASTPDNIYDDEIVGLVGR